MDAKDETAAQALPVKPADWQVPFTASMSAPLPNGGGVTMQGSPAASFDEAIQNLYATHRLYLEWGGWGGGRVVALFLLATNLLY